MESVVGYVVLIACVLGGYLMAHGELMALWQPAELVIIGGAALGAFIASNPLKLTLYLMKSGVGLMFSHKFSKEYCSSLLMLLFELFTVWRKQGIMGIEGDIENPKESELFKRFPKILHDHHLIEFIGDYLRILVSGNMQSHELDALMDLEIGMIAEEAEEPSKAIARIADGLPGFGIVAAVMGIVITMKSLGGPPEELGAHVAASLVGTFLGVLLAYGFVSPFATLIEHKAKEEMTAYKCVKSAVIAMVNTMSPQIAVEFGRKSLPHDFRPTFAELEAKLRGGGGE